jgi:hypothetical protein
MTLAMTLDLEDLSEASTEHRHQLRQEATNAIP